jgi:predicted nucleotidyltransferase
VKSVRNYLRRVNSEGIAVKFGVIFGSQTKGRRGRWSDIDVLVVSAQFDGARNRRDVDLLWQLAAKVDRRIEPVPCGEKQWGEEDCSAIIEIARREGETIGLADQE